jgi:hypothetical protein
MSAKIKYTNEPIDAEVIRDFLPRPEELAFREEGVANRVNRVNK